MQRGPPTRQPTWVFPLTTKLAVWFCASDSASVLRRYLISVSGITVIRRVFLFGLLISRVSSAGEASLPVSPLLHFVSALLCQVLFFFAAASLGQSLRVGRADIDRLQKASLQSEVLLRHNQSLPSPMKKYCFCKTFHSFLPTHISLITLYILFFLGRDARWRASSPPPPPVSPPSDICSGLGAPN